MLKYVFVILAYILGSIPFSYILGRYFRHDDIRKHGSGNIGTTNAFRVFGKIIGISVLLLDTLKSGLLVFLLKNDIIFANVDMFNPLIYGFASVIGHIFPVWFKFKGGKGVACSFGLLLAYSPITAVALIPMFILITVLTRYISLASTFSTL
ncbi:MAG TPA: glycerol-3-phosphate 1-O-acyltransferase PlsY, partial [Bacillota bacterium]|nr:glycerol-3-phosphate 1-O-acyltransferase PlsY [Bacillota bacterium]